MSMIKSYAAKEAGSELELFEYDAGELKPEDVEVQVDYCGICHSDLSMIDNEWGFSQYPLVAGHEVIGRVAALGSAAQAKGLKIGQRVGIGWTARSCGHCDACISGNQINCLEGAVPTILNRGGFAEKLRADWQWVIPLPESIDSESAGPLLCGGITVFKPLLMHHVTATSRVGVIGIGGLGHIAIKLLHAMGCEVTAFSSNPAKEKEVLAMGADKVVNSRDPQALTALAGQFDLIINTVNVDLDWQPYFEALAYGGNFHTVGAVAGEVFAIVNTREVLNGVKQRHQWFSERLNAINARYGLFKEVRGLGLLIGCVLKDEYAGKAKNISNLAAEEGLMMLIAGANVLRFAPALIISEDEVNSGLDRFELACKRFLSGVSS